MNDSRKYLVLHPKHFIAIFTDFGDNFGQLYECKRRKLENLTWRPLFEIIPWNIPFNYCSRPETFQISNIVHFQRIFPGFNLGGASPLRDPV